MQLRPGELGLMRQLVLQLSGVALDEGKGYLVENRLSPIAEKSGCTNFNELYFKLRYGNDAALLQQVVDAITTHETNWFRDGAPYDALQFKLLPECLDNRGRLGAPKKLRIWSAACSTGQEPYSLAMVLHEMIPDIGKWDVQILGTDISQSSLQQAELGVYAEHEVKRTARPQLLAKYFEKHKDGYRVVDSVRRLCVWKQLNLMQPFAALGPFDVVLMRNVLIYFERPAKLDILTRARNALLPHGWFMLGAAENVVELGLDWVPQVHCRATVYQPHQKAPVLVRR